jgi:hypothetical protein
MQFSSSDIKRLISHIPAIWPNLTKEQAEQKRMDIVQQLNSERQMKLFGENQALD